MKKRVCMVFPKEFDHFFVSWLCIWLRKLFYLCFRAYTKGRAGVQKMFEYQIEITDQSFGGSSDKISLICNIKKINATYFPLVHDLDRKFKKQKCTPRTK